MDVASASQAFTRAWSAVAVAQSGLAGIAFTISCVTVTFSTSVRVDRLIVACARPAGAFFLLLMFFSSFLVSAFGRCCRERARGCPPQDGSRHGWDRRPARPIRPGPAIV